MVEIEDLQRENASLKAQLEEAHANSEAVIKELNDKLSASTSELDTLTSTKLPSTLSFIHIQNFTSPMNLARNTPAYSPPCLLL